VTARRKKPASAQPDIFEQYANEASKGGGIDRLLLFGEPTHDGGFDVNPCVVKWLVAIDEAEQGNKSALVALLKVGSVPNVIAPHIGDLIERCYAFTKPKHRPRTPSHRLTDKEVAMSAAGGVRGRSPARRVKARGYDAKRRAKAPGAGK
jgi:hypothetical protein